MLEHDRDPRIANRHSWLKVTVIMLLTLVLVWKIIITPWTVDLSSFRFSDLLSLLLALFAIALAVAFYLKATDTSNRFYDNTYKFTSDVSKILGHIEGEFGERLRHLDEGYSGLQDRFDRAAVDPTRTLKQIKQEEEELRKKEQERSSLIDELASKANMEREEKQKLMDRFSTQEKELDEAKRQIAFLKRQLRGSGEQDADDGPAVGGPPPAFLDYAKMVLLNALGGEAVGSVSHARANARFASIREKLHPAFLRDMVNYGYADKHGQLTSLGYELVTRLASSRAKSDGTRVPA